MKNLFLASTILMALSLVGCLPGSETLVEGTNARLVITGLSAGDTVHIEVNDIIKDATAPSEEPLVIFLELDAGEHIGDALIERDGVSLCAPFVLLVETDAEGAAVASLDARAAPQCELFETVTSLLRLVEDITVAACILEPCHIVTTLEGSGALTHEVLDTATTSGTVTPADFSVFSSRMTSTEANVLFAGDDTDCTLPRPGIPAEQVLLTRTLLIADEDGARQETEAVAVGGCNVGIADEIRDRLGFLRTLAGL